MREFHIRAIRNYLAVKRFSLVAIILFVQACTVGEKEGGCLVEGQQYTLEGTVALEVHPGKPNYKSVKEGDFPRMYWVLTTNNVQTCGRVISKESGELLDSDGHYNRFQLADYEVPRSRLEAIQYTNQRGVETIKLRGEIMFGYNPHHVTEIVLFYATEVD